MSVTGLNCLRTGQHFRPLGTRNQSTVATPRHGLNEGSRDKELRMKKHIEKSEAPATTPKSLIENG